MGKLIELIFVDGNSTDGTVEKIEEMIKGYPERNITLIHQIPRDNLKEELSEEYSRSNKMLKLGGKCSEERI